MERGDCGQMRGDEGGVFQRGGGQGQVIAVAEQVHRSHSMLRSGSPLVHHLRGWARFAVAGYVAGGLATVDALIAADYDVLGREISPTKARTLWPATRLLVGAAG